MTNETMPQKQKIDESQRALVDICFKSGKKLYDDTLNLWFQCTPLFTENQKNLDHLNPIKHYEDYLQEQEQTKPGVYEYVMSLSDPKFIVAFNQLIDEFNADLDRVKKEKDFKKISEYPGKARKIVEGKI